MSGEIVTERPDLCANDLLHAKEMAEALHQHYPGHLWAVHVDGFQGMADVRNLTLSGTHGFRLLLPKMYSMSSFKRRVIFAGGEILERYRLARGKANADHIASLPTNFAGRLLGDLSKG